MKNENFTTPTRAVLTTLRLRNKEPSHHEQVAASLTSLLHHFQQDTLATRSDTQSFGRLNGICRRKTTYQHETCDCRQPVFATTTSSILRETVVHFYRNLTVQKCLSGFFLRSSIFGQFASFNFDSRYELTERHEHRPGPSVIRLNEHSTSTHFTLAQFY